MEEGLGETCLVAKRWEGFPLRLVCLDRWEREFLVLSVLIQFLSKNFQPFVVLYRNKMYNFEGLFSYFVSYIDRQEVLKFIFVCWSF